jgi:hypothetical protein
MVSAAVARQFLPASAPSCSAAPTGRQAQNKQKNDRADEGVYDQRDNANTEMYTELRQQPVAL